MIKHERTKQNVAMRTLSNGLCTVQMLNKIEKDKCEPDKFIVDILLERLGECADELECIISQKAYEKVVQRDEIVENIMNRNYTLARQLISEYDSKPVKTKAELMYSLRMKAYMLLEENTSKEKLCKADNYAVEAINTTLPGCNIINANNYMFSTYECENILLHAQILFMLDENSKEAEQILEVAYNLINEKFKGKRIISRVLPKCVYLMGHFSKNIDDFVMLKRYEEAIELLRRNGTLFYIYPLLEDMFILLRRLGLKCKINKWSPYIELLADIYDEYNGNRSMCSVVFHATKNEYNLENEVAKGQRKNMQLSQEEVSNDVFENCASLSNLEHGKSSPNKNRFESLMDKLGIDKGRISGYEVTESFEMLEKIWNIRSMLTYKKYDKIDELVKEAENFSQKLNVKDLEILNVFRLVERYKQSEINGELFERRIDEMLRKKYDLSLAKYNRKPLLREMDMIFMYLCTVYRYKPSDVLDCWKKLFESFEQSVIDKAYCYRSYSEMVGNYIIHKVMNDTNENIDDFIKMNIYYSFKIGKAGLLSPLFYAMSTNKNIEQRDKIICLKKSYMIAELFYDSSASRKKKDYLTAKESFTLIQS